MLISMDSFPAIASQQFPDSPCDQPIHIDPLFLLLSFLADGTTVHITCNSACSLI